MTLHLNQRQAKELPSKEQHSDSDDSPTGQFENMPSRIIDIDSKSKHNDHVVDDVNKGNVGLWSFRAVGFIVFWYVTSAFTLFMNKYILTTMQGDAILLTLMQLIMTGTWGYTQMHVSLGMSSGTKYEGPMNANFIKNMVIFGILRVATVFFGLVALKFVAVSFTETIKSSAPIFTVLISRFILQERTGIVTQLSLIPIMGGLALCSAYELSFNFAGFIAALATNLSECLVFVVSKLVVSGYKCSAAQTQFYTSVTAILVQIPVCVMAMDIPYVLKTTDSTLLIVYVMNGTFFHFQTMSAWVLMEYVSPVTHSVVNVVKRALLIWISVVLFGNPVTFLSGAGTCIVTAGVLLYNKAREIDRQKFERVDVLRNGKVTSI